MGVRVDTASHRGAISAKGKTVAVFGTGVDVIYQGVLYRHPWRGDADFIVRVDSVSLLGDLSYEELSHELKLNPKTVSSRLSKCLDRLEEIARKVFSREKTGAFPSNL